MSPSFYFFFFSGELQQRANPDLRVQKQSLFCIFMRRGKNHIQKDKLFHSWKKHTLVRDLVIEGEPYKETEDIIYCHDVIG